MKYTIEKNKRRIAAAILMAQAFSYEALAQYSSSTPPSNLSNTGGATSNKFNQVIDYAKPIFKTAIILGFVFCLVMIMWAYTTGHKENAKKYVTALIVCLVLWFVSGAIFSDFGINFSF